MVKKIVLVFILSMVYGTFGLDTNFSPVLFFKNKENKNTYAKGVISSTTPISQREFEQRINALDQNQKIVFLVTDDLSPEDLSIRNEHNRRGFQNLATGVDIVEYIPYVEYAADNKITMGKNVVRATLMSNNELEPKPSDSARIIIVSMPQCDESESRYHCMARIDRACYALGTSAEFKDALFVLTSEMNSQLNEVHSRRARDTGAQPNNDKKPTITPVPGHLYPNPNSLVYFRNLTERPRSIDDKGNKIKVIEETLNVTAVTTTLINNVTIEILFKSKYDILFHFAFDEKTEYWFLNKTLSQFNGSEVILNHDVSAPQNFSYSCNSSFLIQFDKHPELGGLYFTQLQFQLNFTNPATGPNLEKFEDSYDCVGFTSPGIWAGLFITFLLLTIISIAITCIMDIRTMDRFDDPKGKTITISASE